MVASLGMSQKLGNMEYSSRYSSLSSETRALVEAEVNRTVNESYERAKQLLLAHRKELDLLAQALVKYETLSREEVEKVIRGEDLPNRIAVPKGPMAVPATAKLPVPGEVGLPTPPGESGGPPPPAPPPPGGVAASQKPGKTADNDD
jgi:ATP-dependent metalloprotease